MILYCDNDHKIATILNRISCNLLPCALISIVIVHSERQHSAYIRRCWLFHEFATSVNQTTFCISLYAAKYKYVFINLLVSVTYTFYQRHWIQEI